MGVIVLRPRDPESKGVVERHNGYLETSFLPGRRFSSPADFNEQFTDWLWRRANRRIDWNGNSRRDDQIVTPFVLDEMATSKHGAGSTDDASGRSRSCSA